MDRGCSFPCQRLNMGHATDFFEDDGLTDAPSHRLKDAFETSMLKADVPLLSSWEKYKESMPVRHSSRANGDLKLCDLPFYAREPHLEENAKQLETDIVQTTTNDPRYVVAYISAKTESGKTASILPTFLNSYKSNRNRRFTHYLYMAFDNNASNNYKAIGTADKDSDIAMEQGAVFIYECMTNLLNGKYDPSRMQAIEASRLNVLAKNSAVLDFATASIDQLLNDKIPGKHQNILIHLDEHRMMNKNSDFRRGAMIALARCPRVKCVATFIAPLTDLNSGGDSSGVCRQPLVHIPFDPRAYLDKRHFIDIRRLVGRHALDRPQNRKWTTLAFRMAAKVHADCPSSLLFPDLQCDWLQKIQTALNIFDAATDDIETLDKNNGGIAAFKKALGDCLDATKLGAPGAPTHNQFALQLMNGMSELEFTARVGNNSVGCSLTIWNGNVVASWQDLLTLRCNDLWAFGEASKGFIKQLTENDYLSGAPLEEAYGWSMLSRSAVEEALDFGPDAFNFWFKAKHYMPGRLFRASGADHGEELVNPMHLEHGVLYRAAEGIGYKDTLNICSTLNAVDISGGTRPPTATTDQKGSESHPLCDFFFKTDLNELVMIDITGGKDARNKGNRLNTWISNNEEPLTETTGIIGIYGVVLAPFDQGESARDTASGGPPSTPVYLVGEKKRVLLVCDSNAVNMLGALGQLTEWFDPAGLGLAANPVHDDMLSRIRRLFRRIQSWLGVKNVTN